MQLFVMEVEGAVGEISKSGRLGPEGPKSRVEGKPSAAR